MYFMDYVLYLKDYGCNCRLDYLKIKGKIQLFYINNKNLFVNIVNILEPKYARDQLQ